MVVFVMFIFEDSVTVMPFRKFWIVILVIVTLLRRSINNPSSDVRPVGSSRCSRGYPAPLIIILSLSTMMLSIPETSMLMFSKKVWQEQAKHISHKKIVSTSVFPLSSVTRAFCWFLLQISLLEFPYAFFAFFPLMIPVVSCIVFKFCLWEKDAFHEETICWS